MLYRFSQLLERSCFSLLSLSVCVYPISRTLFFLNMVWKVVVPFLTFLFTILAAGDPVITYDVSFATLLPHCLQKKAPVFIVTCQAMRGKIAVSGSPLRDNTRKQNVCVLCS